MEDMLCRDSAMAPEISAEITEGLCAGCVAYRFQSLNNDRQILT